MRRLVVVVVLAALLAAGCAEKKHHEAIETAWSALPSAAAANTERLAALEAFLLQFPKSHEYGNPRAAEAEELVTKLKVAIKQQELARAAEQKVAAAKAAARSLTEQHLFALLAEVDHGVGASLLQPPDEADPVTAALEDARLLTRYRFAAHTVYTRPTEELIEEAQRAIGRTLRSNAAAPVDGEALEALLNALWVAPEDPLLGGAAKQIYPYFRPYVREQLLLLRALDEVTLDAVKKARKAYLARTGQAEDPNPDLVAFYQELTTRTGLLGAFWQALDTDGAWVDVGFWLRREADGSLPILRAFFDRVIQSYDPPLHEELASDKPTAVLAPKLEREPEVERVWAPAPLTGDRLVSVAPRAPSWETRRAAAWHPNGVLLAIQDEPGRVRLVDAKTGEQRIVVLGPAGAWSHAAPPRFSPDGARLTCALRGEGSAVGTDVQRPAEVVVVDVESGEVLERTPWEGRAEIWSLAVHPRGEGVAVADFTRAAWISSTPVADAGPGAAIPLPGAWTVDIHPSGRLAVTGGDQATLVALPSGEKIAEYTALDGVIRAVFSPDGARVLLTARSGDRAHLLKVDEAARALVKEAVLGADKLTNGDWLDDGNIVLFSATERRATAWRLSDRARGATVVGSALLAVDRARRRVVLDTRTDDLVLYSLAASP